MNFFEDLKNRELINQVTSEELETKINNGEIVAYCGVDPTASSIHIGHLLPFLIGKRILKNPKNRFIVLIGGGTSMIGDPKPGGERKILPMETIFENAKSIEKQLRKIFAEQSEQVTFVNNYDWISKINLPEYLREYGKYFSVNNMLAKEVVASRLESGISYAEFSYQVLQAIDYYELNNRYNCNLQLGGSDQWGNIVAGIDLIRKKNNVKTYGLTVPLLLKSDGEKFGKSEKGALFLDPRLTYEFDLYQFFINAADEDLEKLFAQLTFIEYAKITTIINEHNEAPYLRKGQKILAKQIIEMIHGIEKVELCEQLAEILYGKKDQINESEYNFAISQGIESVVVTANQEELIAKITTSAKISKSELSRLLKQQAIKIDGKKVNQIIIDDFSTIGIITIGKKTKIVYKK